MATVSNIPLIERITRNAYRILGLPATATQAEIIAAGNAMRRTVKLDKPVNTPWDFPLVGKLNVSVTDINDALDRLNDPARRVIERLFWFHTGSDKLDEATQQSYYFIADESSLDIHDAASLRLAGALTFDTTFEYISRWQRIIRDWQLATQSEEYWETFRKAELAGDFDRSALADIAATREQALQYLLEDMVRITKDALAADDNRSCVNVFKIIKEASLADDQIEEIKDQLFEELNKKVDSACDEIKKLLAGIVPNYSWEAAVVATNNTICTQATKIFDDQVQLILDIVRGKASANDDYWLDKICETAAMCLYSLSQSWTWADQFVTAKGVYYRALKLLPEKSIYHIRVAADEASYLSLSNKEGDLIKESIYHARVAADEVSNKSLSKKEALIGASICSFFIAFVVFIIAAFYFLSIAGRDGPSPTILDFIMLYLFLLSIIVFIYLLILLFSPNRKLVPKWMVVVLVYWLIFYMYTRPHSPTQQSNVALTPPSPTVSVPPIAPPANIVKEKPSAPVESDESVQLDPVDGYTSILPDREVLRIAPENTTNNSTSNNLAGENNVKTRPPIRTDNISGNRLPVSPAPVVLPRYPIRTDNSIRDALADQIKEAKANIANLKSELSSVDSKIDNLQIQLDNNKQEIDRYERYIRLDMSFDNNAYQRTLKDYNSLVPIFNSWIKKREQVRIKYNDAVDVCNQLVDQYNSR